MNVIIVTVTAIVTQTLDVGTNVMQHVLLLFISSLSKSLQLVKAWIRFFGSMTDQRAS